MEKKTFYAGRAWTIEDVSKYFRMSKTTIYRRVNAGTFPRPDFGGGRGSKMVWMPETIANVKGV